MNYLHIQRAPLHFILYAAGVGMAAGAWLGHPPVEVTVILSIVAVVLFLSGLMFARLTVRDAGDHLLVEFGPLPAFRKRIPYAEITDVQPARSGFLDGWGVHWGPKVGWIYNLWGFDCVKIGLERTMLRIGTDDQANLVAFLRGKIDTLKKSAA